MKFSITFILLTLLLTNCMDREKEYEMMLEGLLDESIPFISPEELRQLDSSYVLLDTRSPEEFRVSHIEGGQFVGFDDFTNEHVAGLPRDTTIIVYCSVGYRSEKVGEKMKALGFKNIRNLYGGIFAWKNRGLPVVDNNGDPTDSIHAYNKTWSRWLWNGVKVYD